jgi:hypothetical protein
VVASVEGARLFVCRYDPQRKTCVVEDQTASYANRNIEEILLSPAFGGTQPYSQEVSELIRQRKQAVQSGDTALRDKLENKLLELNPEYFGHLELDRQLEALREQATEPDAP